MTHMIKVLPLLTAEKICVDFEQDRVSLGTQYHIFTLYDNLIKIPLLLNISSY